MRKETKSIGFVCALGAFIGALLALELRARFQYGMYLWPIGALIGGGVAYIAVDFREFCSGVARAYRATIAWRLNWSYWKAHGAVFLGVNTVLTTVCVILFVAFPKQTVWDICIIFAACQGICLMCPLVIIAHCNDDYLRARSIGFGMLRLGNPFSVACLGLLSTLYIVLTLRRVFFRILKWIPTALVFTKEFVTKVFVSVHSDRRVICFADSVIGATVGFFCGSAFTGALIGAVLGMANYELVSVRWLKLVPVEVK